MIETIREAKAVLEQQGLYVAYNNDRSLWIAGIVRDIGDGIMFSKDSCSLLFDTDRWCAVFPTEGALTYEVPGALDELVQLVQNVYKRYFRADISFPEAFRQVVKDPNRYLLGRPLSHIAE
jgi:hypothetical protein